MGRPSSRVVIGDVTKSGLTLLVQPLCLAVRLGMIAGTEVNLGTKSRAEQSPYLGGKLWSPVRGDFRRDVMELEDVVDHQLGSFPRQWGVSPGQRSVQL